MTNLANPGKLTLALLFFLVSPIITRSYADTLTIVGRELSKVCGPIKQDPGKRGYAYLVDPAGKISEGPIDLGYINGSDLAITEEYSSVPVRYRVVISSSRFVEESRLGLIATRLRPTCSGTSEFLLTAKIDSQRVSPGEIGNSIDIDPDQFFIDTKAYYPIPPQYKFNFSFRGILLSPKPDLVETSTLNKEIDALLVGNARTLLLTLKNIGNAPLIISDLVDIATLSARKVSPEKIGHARAQCADSSADFSEICTLQIQKKKDNCIGRPLSPGETCNIELEKTSDAPLPRGAVYVLNIKSNYRLGFDPRLEFKINKDHKIMGGLKLK